MDATFYNGDDDREANLECSEDTETCGCKVCRDWRENYEPPEREWEPAADLGQQQADALRLKR